MIKKTTLCALGLAVMVGVPTIASAQAKSMKEFQVEDIEGMGKKFADLAGAFAEDDFEWRPMEGVRSVKDVLALAVAEANLFPSMWGATRPTGVAEDFGAEMARVGDMNKAEIIATLNSAFEYMAHAIGGLDDATRMANGTTFGKELTNEAGISYALGDMHEHLGQLIAYARTNEVVPPWSAGGN